MKSLWERASRAGAATTTLPRGLTIILRLSPQSGRLSFGRLGAYPAQLEIALCLNALLPATLPATATRTTTQRKGYYIIEYSWTKN
jgi:hypothetical protein